MVSREPIGKQAVEAPGGQPVCQTTMGNMQLEESHVAKPPPPYPRSVFFIIGNEFAERFSFYGMKAILTLYLTNQFGYSDKKAKDIYHGFSMAAYFTPLFGAILADQYFGKFNTILYISIIYVLGNISMAISPIPGIHINAEMALLGLGLIALGTGGIKPCVAAFGGDQFVEGQEKQLQAFFSLFYLAINSGSLISTLLTPVLKNYVHCFGKDTCYPLAFGVPAAFMVIALIIFVIGKNWYLRVPPSGNIFFRVFGCIATGIAGKCCSKKWERKEHWLDHSEDKWGSQLVNDVKSLLHVLVIFLPLPFFWALFDQQGSTWTLQAKSMDGQLLGYRIIPDQMQVLNPILIVIFIPLFEYVVYPIFAKCNLLKKPLQRMTLGGILTAISFVLAALVQHWIDATQPVILPPQMSRITLVNGLNCDINVTISNQTKMVMAMDSLRWDLNVTEQFLVARLEADCPGKEESSSYQFFANKSLIHYIARNEKGEIWEMQYNDDIAKTKDDCQVMVMSPPSVTNLTVIGPSNLTAHDTYQEASPGKYTFIMDQNKTELELRVGGIYALAVSEDINKTKVMVPHEIVKPHSVHMAWQAIQYIVITMGEILYSITGLEFSYSQASPRMKSVLQAFWLLTVAFGNLIVILINRIEIESKTVQLLIYAGLMAADMLVFALLAVWYKPVPQAGEEEEIGQLEPPPAYSNTYYNEAFNEKSTKL